MYANRWYRQAVQVENGKWDNTGFGRPTRGSLKPDNPPADGRNPCESRVTKVKLSCGL